MPLISIVVKEQDVVDLAHLHTYSCNMGGSQWEMAL